MHLLAVAPVQRGGDVGAERRVPALVLGDELAVDPDLRAVVDRAEMEQHALAASPARRQGAAVPDDRVDSRCRRCRSPATRAGRAR